MFGVGISRWVELGDDVQAKGSVVLGGDMNFCFVGGSGGD